MTLNSKSNINHDLLQGSGAFRNAAIPLESVGVATGWPQAEMIALQALGLAEGHAFLDIGSGCGWLTALGAYLVGEQGSATGIEVRSLEFLCVLGLPKFLGSSWGFIPRFLGCLSFLGFSWVA